MNLGGGGNCNIDLFCHKSFDGVQNENPEGMPFARPYREDGWYTYINVGFDEPSHQTIEALDRYVDSVGTTNPLPMPEERIIDPVMQKFLPTFYKTMMRTIDGRKICNRVSIPFCFLHLVSAYIS